MKKLLLSAAFLSLAAMASAELPAVVITPNVGIGMSNWYETEDVSDVTDADVAYRVGVDVEIPFSRAWSLQTGLALNSMRSEISPRLWGGSATDPSMSFHQSYIELPVQAGFRWHIARRFNILFKLGPYFAVGVGGNTTYGALKASTFGDDGLNLKRFDCGAALDIDFEINQRFVVSALYRGGGVKLRSDFDACNYEAVLKFGYRFSVD